MPYHSLSKLSYPFHDRTITVTQCICINKGSAGNTFTPGTLAGKPPQGNDAKCGFTCNTSVKTRDYVFTDYGQR